MSTRNDPCPCGSGKNFKKCCMSLQLPGGAQPNFGWRPSAAILGEIIATLGECAQLHGSVNCLYWLFGITHKEVPAHVEMSKQLLAIRQQFIEAANEPGDPERTVLLRVNPETLLDSLRTIRSVLQENQKTWRNGPIRLLCSDEELLRIALKVKNEGTVALSKAEFDQHFDIAKLNPYWTYVPDYTIVRVGGGLGLSSPECDIFRAMCHAHDEAVRSKRVLAECREYVIQNVDDDGLIDLGKMTTPKTETMRLLTLGFGRAPKGHRPCLGTEWPTWGTGGNTFGAC